MIMYNNIKSALEHGKSIKDCWSCKDYRSTNTSNTSTIFIYNKYDIDIYCYCDSCYSESAFKAIVMDNPDCYKILNKKEYEDKISTILTMM